MPCGYWLLLTRLWLRNMLIVKLLLKWDLQFPPTLSSTCTGDNYLGDASLIQTTDGKISSCPTWLHQKPGEDWLRTESHLYMSNSQTCIRQLYVKAAMCVPRCYHVWGWAQKEATHQREAQDAHIHLPRNRLSQAKRLQECQLKTQKFPLQSITSINTLHTKAPALRCEWRTLDESAVVFELYVLFWYEETPIHQH